MIFSRGLAASTLVAVGGAAAQSSVTLFGVLDAAISSYSVKSEFQRGTGNAIAPLVSPPGVKRSQTVLSNSAHTQSRIGFRGTEDLGGGLAAGFWLEAPLGNDDGTGGGNFSRRSTVSLSGPFGEVRLGRDYTPSFWSDTVFDPFGNNGVGATLITSVGSRLAVSAATAGGGLFNSFSPTDNFFRTSNSVGYFLPRDLGGFYGQVMYAFHENIKSSGTAQSPNTRGRYAGGRFGYADGPIDIAVAYGESTTADGLIGSAVADRKLKIVNVAGSYELGFARLFAELSQMSDVSHSVNTVGIDNLTKDKYRGGLVGVTVPIGVGVIRASYSRMKFTDDPGTVPLLASALTTTANKVAIGYVHNLSRRTALYATVARIKISDGQNNSAIMGATTGGSPTYLVTGGPAGGYAPRSARGYDFGIRHSF